MNVGQKVLLINQLNARGWGEVKVPPIGSIGFIESPMDEFNEYDVSFDGYPHPAINDPDWIVTSREIIPIFDDGEINVEEEDELEVVYEYTKR